MRPGERGWGSLCAAHVANWLVSCHLVFLQIGKLSFSAGALELLSLLSRLLQMIGYADREAFVPNAFVFYVLLLEHFFKICLTVCIDATFRAVKQL